MVTPDSMGLEGNGVRICRVVIEWGVITFAIELLTANEEVTKRFATLSLLGKGFEQRSNQVNEKAFIDVAGVQTVDSVAVKTAAQV